MAKVSFIGGQREYYTIRPGDDVTDLLIQNEVAIVQNSRKHLDFRRFW